MTRDYAKEKSTKNSLPGWAWLLGGLVIGLFVALLVYLNEQSSQKQKSLVTGLVKKSVEEVRSVRQQRQEAPPGPDGNNGEKPRPRFDFYTILQEQEVAIPEQELSSAIKPTPNTSTPLAAITATGSFYLQAGSFRKQEEADRLRARLALAGIVADIQTVSISEGDTWHRVRIGPINDVKLLNQTRHRLQDQGIASMVVRNKQ